MKILKLILLLFILTFFSCRVEPIGKSLVTSTEKIKRDAELFNLLEKITADGDNPTEHIVCIDFIYPFKVLIYDSNLQNIGSESIFSDIQFSAFLGSLPTNHSISISYPISTTLADGTIFSINNNSELKLAIDSCSQDDIIDYCNGLFGGCNCPETICIWKIPYTIDEDNKYASGFFESNNDGTLHFTYNGENYTGTWVFLFVDNKLHLNINLEGTSQVAQDWAIDREIEMSNDGIKIKNTPKNIILSKSCQLTTEYQIGATGPGGGIVFYDKGSYSFGWRFMEVALTDLNISEWGCVGSLIPNANNTQIGNGLLNSIAIANYHDNLLNYYTNPAVCNPLNNGTVIAKEALAYQLNGKKDWFLPSEDELTLLYINLHLQNLGAFSNNIYWSSSENDSDSVKTIDFSNGQNIVSLKVPPQQTIKARCIRCF